MFVALAFFPDSRVDATEFANVKDLAIFLIAALLPSDVLIRYGRTQFMKGQERRGVDRDKQVRPSDLPKATLPQYLAFVAFVATVILTLVDSDIVTSSEFGQVDDVLRTLIVALLPSEATLRFSRALYLSDKPEAGRKHAKLI